MKVFYRYTAMILLLVVAAGGSFWVPRRNLRGIGQVAGIALDRQEDCIRATFELYAPAVDEPIGKNRQTVTATGASLEECIQNARLVSGWELFIDDALVLILGSKDHTFLLPKVLAYYSSFKNDHMDLPVNRHQRFLMGRALLFQWIWQRAAKTQINCKQFVIL